MLRQLHPGEQLDHYLLGNVAARSGMASIFRGTDTRTGAQVAVKVPHPEMECDPLFFDRFQREAEIGRTLDHPGVVKVMPKDGQTRVYMVMEWLEGRLLRQVLSAQQGKKLSAERATRLTLGILDALEYIHSHGVVHRDLKPENIMVDEDDRIKLIDFGIAGKTGERRLTFHGFTRLMGTPDYISPEQVDGKRGDARSDLYAVGVMLYEMLTGQTPFSGPNPLAIMNQRLNNYPVPPRQRAGGGLGPGASGPGGCGRSRRNARMEAGAQASAAKDPVLLWPGCDSRGRFRAAGTGRQERLSFTFVGRTPLLRAGPPGPAPECRHKTTTRPTGASAADQGVHPTTLCATASPSPALHAAGATCAWPTIETDPGTNRPPGWCRA